MQVRAFGAVLSALLLAGACSELSMPVTPSARIDPTTKPRFVVDAEQGAIDASVSPLALYPLDPDPGTFGEFKQNLAQTFTASATEILSYLALPVACQPGVQLRLQIKSGGPDGTLLFDRSYDLGKFYADGAFIELQIYGGVALTGGSTYAFVLSSSGDPGSCSIIKGPPGDSYAGGDGFESNPGFTPYWCAFSNFGSTEAWDLPFRTLVR